MYKKGLAQNSDSLEGLSFTFSQNSFSTLPIRHRCPSVGSILSPALSLSGSLLAF